MLHAGAAESVEDGQQGLGPAGGVPRPAAQLGHAGKRSLRAGAQGVGLGQDRGEQAAGDRETDALGLGRTGKGSEAVLIDDYGGVEDGPEFAEVLAEFGDLIAESLELCGGVRFIEGLEDPVGVAIQGLPGKAVLLGPSGDSAVGSVEDSGGIGDAELGG